MRKIFIIAFLIILNINIYVPVYAENTASSPPDVDADGAVLMDFKTGKVLWEKNSDKPLAMASTTKIMTAVTAIENCDLDETVKISKRAASAPPVKMSLKVNEEIKLKYLLYALMMQSSNDAAVAIAEHVGGSVENFCAEMTKRAKELGAENTVFKTPNGLDSEDHHSTAYDMAVITRYALNNDKFNEIINTKEITFKSSTTTYSVINKNRLLYEYEGANGVKTGYTGKAGHCFVGSAKRGDIQLISVVLASGWGNKGKNQKWVDSKSILNYGFNNFEYKTIVNKGTDAGSALVLKAKEKEISFSYNNDFIIPINKNENNDISIKVNLPEVIEAPVKKGTVYGYADIIINGKKCGKIDIVSDSNIKRHDLRTSWDKIINEWLKLGY